MKRHLALILAPLILLSVPARSQQADQTYWFRKVADSYRSFAQFSPPSVNNHNAVAFAAVQRSGDVGVFVVKDGRFETILRSGAAARGAGINDGGMVTFARELYPDDTGGGLYASRNGRLTTVVSDGLISNWSANNRGTIALNRNIAFDVNALYVFDGVRLSQVPGSRTGDDLPHINAQDNLVFIRHEPERNMLYLSRAGGTPAMLLDSDTSRFRDMSTAAVNAAGLIALSASEDVEEGQEAVSGIYLIKDGVVTKYVDNRGPFAGYFFSLAVNDRGCIAFLSTLDDGTVGIFTGPDPRRDKVIAVGDALFGSTVAELGFDRDGLNDGDVLAFRAVLADGRHVLALAHPRRD